MATEGRCMNCGVSIEKDYILFINGNEFKFDSFECAINFVAPRCANCNSIIIGHPTKSHSDIFCSPHCACSEIYSSTIP